MYKWGFLVFMLNIGLMIGICNFNIGDVERGIVIFLLVIYLFYVKI